LNTINLSNQLYKMGLAITKFLGGDINEYDGQYILYNKYPYYNTRRRPMTTKQREYFNRRNAVFPTNKKL
jgi:hypothetical protein